MTMTNTRIYQEWFNLTVSGLLVFSQLSTDVHAVSYELTNSETSIIGQVKTVAADGNITLLDIARAYGLGYQDIKLVNPDVDTWLPRKGQVVKLPSKFVLPNAPRQGIVMNIPEMRLYYYPPPAADGSIIVETYPLGIGRQGWATPYKITRIIAKQERPAWRPPKSILAEHEAAGDPLPELVEPGPDNPLGNYALRLGLPAYLIHGTNQPWGIGMRVSHGCIRLYPEDIAELYSKVEIGTVVNIIDNPFKVGELDGVLYLEAHPPLAESVSAAYLTQVVRMIINITQENSYTVDWEKIGKVTEKPTGIPVPIGIFIPQANEDVVLQADGASE